MQKLYVQVVHQILDFLILPKGATRQESFVRQTMFSEKREKLLPEDPTEVSSLITDSNPIILNLSHHGFSSALLS